MKFPSTSSFPKLPSLPKLFLPKFRLPFGGGAKKQGATCCGLDIGSQRVKWVEIRHAGKPELVAYSSIPIKKGIGREKTLTALKEAIQASGSTTRRVHSAIGGQSVIIRYIQLPRMSREELRSSIEFEADKYIPFNVKDVILDCQVLEEKEELNKILAVLVAAKKEAVNHHLSLLQEAGLEVDLLDVDTFAIANAFEHFLGTQSPTTIHALLDLGAKTTNTSILRGSTSLFSRDVPIGGDDFTQAIAEKLNLEMEAADVLKCSGTKSSEELLALVNTPLENLVGELRLSFDYFENQYDKRVERLYLSGGSSRLTGLLDYLRKSFNTEALFWNPLEGISVPSHGNFAKLKDAKEGLAVGVGLALRGVE
ncbi:MAG: type IV pilus assembly protein PilM [Candidatus Omnitrophica bacterium]|nr:type IV pilus assembly protein PilM [Candidatus Omnitrophota bacterium]